MEGPVTCVNVHCAPLVIQHRASVLAAGKNASMFWLLKFDAIQDTIQLIKDRMPDVKALELCSEVHCKDLSMQRCKAGAGQNHLMDMLHCPQQRSTQHWT